ncbi:MAG: hypothetical protein ACRDOP_14015 [Gaiellaceae bacterium]
MAGSSRPFRREAPILGAGGFQDAHRSLVALPLEQLDVLLAIGARRRRHLSELEAPERRRRLRVAA